MNEASPKQYTSFWPVLIVFACFTVTNVLNLIGNLETRNYLNNALVQLQGQAVQAKAKQVALSGLAHDLVDLAPTSAVAQQIVTDFHIQLKNPAGQAAPATAAPAPTPYPAPVSNASKP